jgi:tetratricopeptide (TPR) repeat protein
MKRAMELHERGLARVIPIILRPTPWQGAPFSKLQVLPKEGRPVTEWKNRDDAFVDIVREIRNVATRLQESLAVQVDWVVEGDRLMGVNQYKEALAAFEQAIFLAPSNAAAYVGRGDALRGLGQSTEALTTYEQAIRLKPANTDAYIGRGRALRDMGRFTEALSTYQQAVQLAPNNAIAYLEMGIVLSSLQRHEDALTAYQRASSLTPYNSTIYLSVGSTLRRLERYQEALEAYEKASQLSSNDVGTELYLGELLLQLQRHEQALEAYKRAVDLDPKNVDARLGMGEALLQLKRFEEALIAFDTAIIFGPNYARAYEGKAAILHILGHSAEAVSVTEQAVNRGLNVVGDIAVRLNLREEGIEIQASQTRIELVQQFLTTAGFDLEIFPSEVGFLARVRTSTWRTYFPRGLYIRVLLDNPLDQLTVQAISHDAKNHGIDHALVIINQQPDFSGSAEINILRWEQGRRHFVCLPIDESLILESIATHKEQLDLQKYVSKRLGHGFDPYSVVDPVYGAVSFFGRQRLTEELSDALRRGQRLGLFGIQKMGKSSVLQQLQKGIEFPVAYVYLKTNDTLDRIYRRILTDWALNGRVKYPTDFKWAVPHLPPNTIAPSIFDDATKSLLAYLNTMTGVGVSPMLGIFLDEIEHIVPERGDEKTLQLYIDLMDSLRGLYQETQSIGLLFAGVHPGVARYNYFWGNQKNPMYQIIAERFLSPLDEEDCSNMIRSLGQQINLQYDKGALNYILEMSGSHPFLARRLCSLAYKGRKDSRSVSVEMVAAAVQEFVSNPQLNSYFNERGLWGELSQSNHWKDEVGKANQELLLRLAAASQDLSENELCAKLDRNVALEALYALKERSLINSPDNSGYYHITFGLLRNWIRFRQLGMSLD